MTENSKAAAQAEYKRVIIAFHDLSDCRLYLNRLTGRNGEIPPGSADYAQRNALMTAIVVSYARPFSGNRAAKDVARRLPPAFMETLSAEELDLHARVLKLRNREFAHSDPEVSQVRVTVGAVAGGERLAMPVSNVPRQGLSVEELNRLDGLCGKLHVYLHDAMLKLQKNFDPGDTF